MADPATGRILMTTDAVGGVWTYSLDLAREFAARGTETVLAVMGPAPSEVRAGAARTIAGLTLVDTGLPLDWIASTRAQVLAAAEELSHLARTSGASLVHLHTPSLAAGRPFDVPVVSMHHSCLATWWKAVKCDAPVPEDFTWRNALAAEGLGASDIVAVPTLAFGHLIADTYGLATPPVVICNGRSATPEAGISALRDAFVMSSGRLWDEGKNFAALDRAAALLDVPVMAAGPVDAPHGNSMDFRHLKLLGSLGEDEMRTWLGSAPVFVSTALYEPFGLGVLEAAQAGCALVLSDIPTFRELWAGAALFVPPTDERATARALASVLRDDALRARLSARALHRSQTYTAEAMGRATWRLHQGLISQQPVQKHEAAA